MPRDDAGQGGRWQATERSNRWLLRARDAMDRDFAEPLDIPALARLAHVSEGYFIRSFQATFGETPHRYLQRRRVERAMALLRTSERSVTEISLAVGFNSLGTFSRTFHAIVGESPSAYRRGRPAPPVPGCFTMAWNRPATGLRFADVARSVSDKPTTAPGP